MDIDAATVNAIADLARKGVEGKLGGITIEGQGLGDGLPRDIPMFLAPGAAPASLAALIETYRQAPARRVGTATVTSLRSFIDLIERHKDAHSAVFAETAMPGAKLTGVIDYHQTDGAPRHAQHRVVYPFPVTPELTAWLGQNGKPMEQLAFATFLEEHAADLASPTDAERIEWERLFKERFSAPNELLDLSRSLEICVGQTVKRAERLQSGERTIEFVETQTDRAGNKVDVPGIFMVSVQAFVDGDPIRMPARLRYRVKAGDISWHYQLYRPDFWIRNQVQIDLDKVGRETGLPTYEGTPEAPSR